MTDARLPGRWLTDPHLEELSDRLWRVHTGALMWSAEQGTDGLIPRRTLRLLHPEIATLEDAHALVEAGLWDVAGDEFQVLDWARSQTLAADIEHQRERNRQKQRAHRARLNAERSNGDATDDVTGYVPGESQRLGEDRLGEASSSKVSISETVHVADDDAVSGVDATHPEFDRVWSVWPKKASKKTARAKFTAAAKRHPRGALGLAEDAAAHAHAYVQHAHPVQYVPMLSTWLNGDRWDDPLPGPRARTSGVEQNASVLARYAGGDE